MTELEMLEVPQIGSGGVTEPVHQIYLQQYNYMISNIRSPHFKLNNWLVKQYCIKEMYNNANLKRMYQGVFFVWHAVIIF